MISWIANWEDKEFPFMKISIVWLVLTHPLPEGPLSHAYMYSMQTGRGWLARDEVRVT